MSKEKLNAGKSIRFQTCVVFFSIMMPFLLGIVSICIWFIHIYSERIRTPYENMVAVSSEQIGNTLNESHVYLQNIIANNDDFLYLQADNSSVRNLALVNLKNYIDKNAPLNENIFYYFIYNPELDFYMSSYGSSGNQNVIVSIKDYILNEYKNQDNIDSNVSDMWNLVSIYGEEYYIYSVHAGGTHMGALIPADVLLKSYSGLNDSDVSFLLVSQNFHSPSEYINNSVPADTLYDMNSGGSLKGENTDWYVLSAPILHSDTKFLILIDKNKLSPGSNWGNVLILFFVAFCLVSVPSLYMYINKNIVLPLERLCMKMRNFAEQSAFESESQMNLKRENINRENSVEFCVIHETLEAMVERLSLLKNAQLRFLQLQTNPHFMLNGLTMIYNLSIKNEQAQISDYSMLLIKHLRFMMNLSKTTVSLKEEAEFTGNYIEILKQRLAYPILWDIEIPEELDTAGIPPFAIQTFVENSVKYGVSKDGIIRIKIHVSGGGDDSVEIRIEDQGAGFSSEILEKINRGEDIIDHYENYHIGIRNVRERLTLIYENTASLKVENGKTSGGIIILNIPQTIANRL